MSSLNFSLFFFAFLIHFPFQRFFKVCRLHFTTMCPFLQMWLSMCSWVSVFVPLCVWVCACLCVCVCVCVLMCPWLRLVGTTLSCLSAHVNAKPAHMKHDDVFLFCFFFKTCVWSVCVYCVCFMSLCCFSCIKVIAAKTFILRGWRWLKQQGVWPLANSVCASTKWAYQGVCWASMCTRVSRLSQVGVSQCLHRCMCVCSCMCVSKWYTV